MDSLRQPKFSQASVWFPSWFYSVFPDTNGASTQWFLDKEDDMVVASSRSGHRGIVLTLEESSCFDCNEVKGQKVLNYGYFAHPEKGLNCGILGVTCTPSEHCHCINLFESVHAMGITVDQFNEPDALLTGSVKELCTFNNGCSRKCLMMDHHVHIPVESKQAGVWSSADMTSKQTSSTEFYEAPVVSGRNEIVPALPCLGYNNCSSKQVALLLKRFSLSLKISSCCKFVDKATGYSILHKKSAGDTEDKSRVRVPKRKISEKTMNTSRKKKGHQSVVADLEATVALTVAAAEAMVIASCLVSCNAPNEFGRSVVLEAAMRVRKARQSIGLDDFFMEMQTPLDVIDFTESECLANSQKVLADGGFVKLMEDKSTPCHILGNVEGKCEISQHKEKESTIHPRRQLCKFKKNEGPYAYTADEEHGEFNALDCKKLGSTLLLESYDKNSQAASPYSIVEERPCNVATCLWSSQSPEHNFLSRKEEKFCSSWSKNAFSGGPDANDSKRPFKPFFSRWFGGWAGIGDYADEKTGDLINSQSSQAFSGYQDTTYLKEPNFLQKIVNLKANRHYVSRKYNPLTIIKANSESKSLLTKKEPIVVSVPEKQPQNLSQASVAGSISSSGDPLCSFVPCSLLSPPLPFAAFSKVDDSFKERAYTLKFANTQNVNESTKMMNISRANVFGKVCLHNSPVRLMSRNLQGDPFLDKDDGPCLNSTGDGKGSEVKGVKRSRAVSLRLYSTNSNSLGELLEAVNCICDQNQKKGPGISSNRVENDLKYRSSGAGSSGQGHNASEPAVVLKENTALLDSILSPTNFTGGNSGKTVSIEVPATAVASRDETKRKVKFSDVSPPHYFVKWHLSPPLLFPHGRRKRLKAEIIVDTGSSDEIFPENLQGLSRSSSEDVDNIPALGRKNNVGFINKDETCPNKSKSGISDQHNDKIEPTLFNSTSTAEGMTKHQKLKDRCRDKVKLFSNRKMAEIKVCSKESQKRHLFRGLKFLLTGFTENKKKTVLKLIKVYGGEIALNVPQSCSSQVAKTQRVVCREKQYIVIAAKKVRTPKFLYGCAVGSPPLEPSWIMDSISAGKRLSQSQYKLAYDQELKQRFSKAGNRYENNQRKGKIFGGMLFLIYGRATFRSKVTPILQHGGGQILQRSRSIQCEKSETKLSQVVIVEDMDKIPRGVRHSATNLNVPIVSEKWVVESLIQGSLLELPATSGQGRLKKTTMKNSVLPFSSADCIRKCQTLVPTTTDPSNELTKTCQQSALGKNQHNTSIHPKNSVRNSFQKGHKGPDFTLVGRGFSIPPEVSTFAYTKSKQLQDANWINHCPRNRLYYKEVLYAGVDYSVGDCVEIWQYLRGKIFSSIVRIECFWLEEASFKTRASKLTSGKACYMLCRRFYCPQDTTFAGCGSEKEIFVSNDFEESVSICKLQRKVKIVVKIGENISIPQNRGNNQGDLNLKRSLRSLDLINFDYACNFFYNHEHESLHLLS